MIKKNTSLLSTQSNLVNRTRSETLNDSIIPVFANGSIRLKKDRISFSPLKKTETKKLLNNGCAFSNYLHAELNVDETSIADNRIGRKKKSHTEAIRYGNTLTCTNTTDLSNLL